jgi:hypothetical protein
MSSMDPKDEWRQKRRPWKKKSRDRCDENHLKYVQQQYWNNDLITSTPLPALSLLTKLFQMEELWNAHWPLTPLTSPLELLMPPVGNLALPECSPSFEQDFHLAYRIRGYIAACQVITLAAVSVRFDPRLNVQAPWPSMTGINWLLWLALCG